MVDSLGLGWSRRLCPGPRVPQPSGCVYSVQERFKQLLRGAVAELSAGPSVQLVSSGEDILVGRTRHGGRSWLPSPPRWSCRGYGTQGSSGSSSPAERRLRTPFQTSFQPRYRPPSGLLPCGEKQSPDGLKCLRRNAFCSPEPGASSSFASMLQAIPWDGWADILSTPYCRVCGSKPS